MKRCASVLRAPKNLEYCPTIGRRTVSNSSSRWNASKKPGQSTEPPVLPRLQVDENTLDLLNDMNLGVGSMKKRRPLIYNEDHEQESSHSHVERSENIDRFDRHSEMEIMTEAEELQALDEVAKIAGDEIWRYSQLNQEDGAYLGPREERRSPAVVFGSKRIGMVVLPEELSSAIQKQTDAVENPKLLRQAYLAQMSTRNSPRAGPSSRGSSKRAHLSSSLQEHNASPRNSDPTKTYVNTRRKDSVTPLTALLSAIVDLPIEYAAVRNVLRELKGRLGNEEWQDLCGNTDGQGGGIAKGKWLILDGGVGAGIWALQDTLRLLPSSWDETQTHANVPVNFSVDVVQGSRHILDLSQSLVQDADLQGEVKFSRLYRESEKPNVILAPFLLSKLPNQSARRRKLQEMWNTGADTIILADEGSSEGFRMIADARQFLLELGRKTPVGAGELKPEELDRIVLRQKRRAKKARRKAREQGEVEMIDGKEVIRIGDQIFYLDESTAEAVEVEEYELENIQVKGSSASVNPASKVESQFVGSHVVAPCPHDGICPLLATRDNCHFSQRTQSPRFLRKTKHNKDGELDANYTYVVIRRGHRPLALEEPVGLVGGVAIEALERQAQKEESMRQGFIVPIKGAQDGSFEVMRFIPPAAITGPTEPRDDVALEKDLQRAAYHWPRLVYPPLKRSGHVVMDTCHPSGSIVRLTVSKSQSKQAYHDARKVMWGDLFPHQPKSKEIIRDRGIKKLNKMGQDSIDDEYDLGGDEEFPGVTFEQAVDSGVTTSATRESTVADPLGNRL